MDRGADVDAEARTAPRPATLRRARECPASWPALPAALSATRPGPAADNPRRPLRCRRERAGVAREHDAGEGFQCVSRARRARIGVDAVRDGPPGAQYEIGREQLHAARIIDRAAHALGEEVTAVIAATAMTMAAISTPSSPARHSRARPRSAKRSVRAARRVVRRHRSVRQWPSPPGQLPASSAGCAHSARQSARRA